MAEMYSYCSLLKYDSDQFSLVFTDFDLFLGFLESRGGQAGGYSWQAIIRAALELAQVELPNVEFEPEDDMFLAVSPEIGSLQRIQDVIAELAINPDLMDLAVERAKDRGYFQ